MDIGAASTAATRQHVGQPLRGVTHGDALASLVLAEHLAHQKPHGAGSLIDAASRQMPLAHQVQQIGLDLLVGDQLRGSAVVTGHLRDNPQVGLLRAWPEATQHHRIDHALT